MKRSSQKVPSTTVRRREVKIKVTKIGVIKGKEVTTEIEKKAGIEIMTKRIMKRGNDPIRIERGKMRGMLMLTTGTERKTTVAGTNTKCRGKGLGLAPGHMTDGKRRELRGTPVIKVEIAIKSEKKRDKATVTDIMRRETEEEIEAMMERTRIEGEIEMVGEMDVTEAMIQEIMTEVEIKRVTIEIPTAVSIEAIMARRIVGGEGLLTTSIFNCHFKPQNSHRIISRCKS